MLGYLSAVSCWVSLPACGMSKAPSCGRKRPFSIGAAVKDNHNTSQKDLP